MIDIKDKSDCCGCTACASVCKHNAISMQPDIMGFLYPVVDKSICVDCGLCEKVCAFNEHYDTSLNLPQPEAYAARHKKLEEVETSRSGAAFIAISDYILEDDKNAGKKVRKDATYNKDYLTGRYGAIPVLDNFVKF